MSISGNILIDKLRICIHVEALTEIGQTAESYMEYVRVVLSNYFYTRAYSVSKSRGEVKITLTPTRFKPPNNANFTDVNIEMPAEYWLLNLFQELGFSNRRYSESSRIVWIHLTKNIIVNNSVSRYIEFLSGCPLCKGYKSGVVYSSSNNHTLRISTQKHNTEKDDINGQRSIIIYDKCQELRDKANLDHIYLKESLSDKEVAELTSHNVFYDRNMNRLSLHNLNLLRCEVQYRYKEKIKPLANFLNDNGEDTLKIATIMNLLKNNQLYTMLETFYTNQLKEVIFYKNPEKQENKSLTSFQKTFSELIQISDINELQLIYKACELNDKFHKNLKKLYKAEMNELYKELYIKLIFNSNRTQSVQKGHLL